MTTASVVLLAFGVLAALVLSAWAIARIFLCGPDLSVYDRPVLPPLSRPGPPSAAHGAVVESLATAPARLNAVPRSSRLAAFREYLDNLFPVDASLATITGVDAGGVPAEWVVAAGANPARRLLYIHGGAFVMGSPLSHRRLTTKFSEIAGAAVLAIDYRLMPEHARMAGVEDCRRAYRWMLANGPGGAADARAAFVAGDSAGGNLALSLIAWVRDNGLRAPDAVVALCPATDATLGSPSLRANVRTDPMLGPLFGPMAKVPRWLLLLGARVQARVNPRDPVVSPVYGDLSNLPPVLVHASEAEMLRDDARRYANRAAAAGSPVRLQTWEHMVHVWHIFHPDLPEARDALEEIRKFIASVDAARPAASIACGA